MNHIRQIIKNNKMESHSLIKENNIKVMQTSYKRKHGKTYIGENGVNMDTGHIRQRP